MPRTKNYTARNPASLVPQADLRVPGEASVELPPNPGGLRSVDFTKWLGRGIDDWVSSCVGLLASLRDSGSVSVATVGAYGSIGCAGFFDFLTAMAPGGTPVATSAFRGSHLRQFIAWLKLKYRKQSTAGNRYSNAKSILVGLMERGVVTGDPQDFFPRNPFPGAASSKKGESGLTLTEMERLAGALKQDLVDLHQNRFRGAASEALAVYFLVVSMRSGCNTTPLIEMPRDALGPHPFLPNMMLLTSHKRRGNATRLVPLRYSETQESVFTVPMDAVAILKKAMDMTSSIVAEAPAHLRNRVWLYRAASGPIAGKVTALIPQVLLGRLRDIVARRNVLGDDGQPLRVTPQRLRKTMENRLWRLSDGDLTGVAEVMGHLPQVADNHYLQMDSKTEEEAAQFIGEALQATLRSDGTAKPVIPVHLQNTPAGSCKDSLYGAKAPKDGSNECEQFMHCVGCPSYAIVGTVKDLHRLFSFQLFIQEEVDYYTGDEWERWRAHHKNLAELIDRFTTKHFAAGTVQEAKLLASTAPHKFWAQRIARARTARGGPDGVQSV